MLLAGSRCGRPSPYECQPGGAPQACGWRAHACSVIASVPLREERHTGKRRNPGDVARGPGIVPGSSPPEWTKSRPASTRRGPDGMSDTVTWEDRVVAERLTLGRLGSYLAATADDVPLAMRLYEWNGAVAGALLPTVGAAEVIVRNAIDERLRGWSRSAGAGPRWFTALPLDQRGEADVAKAIARATRWGARPEVHGQVLAELSLSLSLSLSDSGATWSAAGT